jgi:cell division septal protein FtsQ
MKRKTTKHRRSTRQNVLEVRVMSPRIAWLGFLSLLGRVAKIACLLAVLTAIGWGVWRGVDHAFYQNPDFRLKILDLNPNDVIDEIGVAEVAGIDLTAGKNLFEINVTDTVEALEALPAVVEARAERHLPATLVVRVVPRVPKAWLCTAGDAADQSRRVGATLVDHDGVAYPCPELQFEAAAKLPLIELSQSAEHPVVAGARVQHPDLPHCLMLLDSARRADPEASQWIERIRKGNEWSLELVTREGTIATFSLGDHPRQIENLRTALDHAGEKGYVIHTINLIPKYNIPITVRDGSGAPRAIPVSEPDALSTVPGGAERRARDIGSLLNRN